MNVRPLAATRRRASAVGITVLVVAFIAAGGQTIARAQARASRQPASATSPARRATFILTACRDMAARYSPYPVKDPTADERAVVAGRVYRAVLDESAQRAIDSASTGTSGAGC